MQLRGGEERNRTVHKIARPHEVIATEILIPTRLLWRSRSSGVQFQARQMLLNFQVGSSLGIGLYENAVHDSLSGIASTARRLGSVNAHSPK